MEGSGTMNTYSRVCERWLETLRSVALLIALSCAAVLGVGAARADDGRDFTGTYDIVATSVIDADNTRVTVRLHVQNVSGHDVANAVVLLMGDRPNAELGAFPALMDASDRQIVHFEESFDVPNQSVQNWQQGPGPQFQVLYQDAEGREQRRPVEAARMPLGREG